MGCRSTKGDVRVMESEFCCSTNYAGESMRDGGIGLN